MMHAALTLLMAAAGPLGYYRQPTLHEDRIVFVAEGDLFVVASDGGRAQRLTAHPGLEHSPAFSPDGLFVAFVGERDQLSDAYVIPSEGGAAQRLTYDGSVLSIVGWTPDGRVMVRTDGRSGLPAVQLVLLETKSRSREVLPLDRAFDGSYAEDVLFFTRPGRQRSETARYQGGTAQDIWRFDGTGKEAYRVGATVRTERNPMPMNDRIYFESDRSHDGQGGDVMNLWSMTPDGSDARIHTRGTDFGIQDADAQGGKIVFQRGADLWLYDVQENAETRLDITLVTDFDQRRRRVETELWPYLGSTALTQNDDGVAMTVRGRGFVVPTGLNRRVRLDDRGVGRLRELQPIPSTEDLLAFGDGTGEMDLYRLSRRALELPERITRLGPGFRSELSVSPDGSKAAFRDRSLGLYLTDLKSGRTERIAEGKRSGFTDLSWSPDSAWLAYVGTSDNGFRTLRLHRVGSNRNHVVSSDRFHAASPSFDPTGSWLYFLSNRNLESVVPSPWGDYQPEPYFDRRTRIMALPLSGPQRSPFAPFDELHPAPPPEEASKADKKVPDDRGSSKPRKVTIQLEGCIGRMLMVPLPAGNYRSLKVGNGRLYWLTDESPFGGSTKLQTIPIENRDRTDLEAKTLIEDVESYSLGLSRRYLLVRKERALYVVPAGDKFPKKLEDHRVNLEDWVLGYVPHEEWKQMFLESWRLQRDYFYDPDLHGVDWEALKARYLPLVERVTDRHELNDVISQMMAELSALHVFVRGGDTRTENYQVATGRLGATLVLESGGAIIQHIYRAAPERIESRSPLADPVLDIREGDRITAINGKAVDDAGSVDALLWGEAGHQVRLQILREGKRDDGPVLVETMSPDAEEDLRYAEWEYQRRRRVEREGKGMVGYVHLRAMGRSDIGDWAEQFYPVVDRPGLIIDVRNNRGGNIDSWLLEKLLRRAWFWWKPRAGEPVANMQYAYRGHIIVLINEWTASDGEAFAEGFRRLGLGKLYGVRTWGGEIWLNFDTGLADGGIATAPQFGVYAPKGGWLIEGHGVEPDVRVENLPHATFNGEDAQLDRALKDILRAIETDPKPVPEPPPYPNKSLPPEKR
ncbi:MAG: S41 family peptidase [Myxococcota bacterium]